MIRASSKVRRGGFTIIELLVVIGIIGVIMALLVPAVQQARESARRIECTNKLHQIGLAIHSFESTYQKFPAGKTSFRSEPTRPEMSWLTVILPYVEQSPLYDKAMAAFDISRLPYLNPPHLGLGKPVRAFSCPDDARVENAQSATSLNGAYAALTSYIGISGIDFRDTEGVLYFEAQTRFRDITDGSSNTLLVGERPPSPDFNFGWWYTGAGQDGSGNADMHMGVQERVAEPGSRFSGIGCPSISAFTAGLISTQCDALHFWSLHPGGGNFLYCDGSVRFLSYASAHLLPVQATKSGGEMLE